MKRAMGAAPRARRQGLGRGLWRGAVGACGLLAAAAAQAHVKWFSPYAVDTAPRAPADTLANPGFWAAVGLGLAFFLAAGGLEMTAAGQRVLGLINQVTDPLWRRLDDLLRALIAGFFVAIFAIGGTYLTPELKTDHEWVSWLQLAIAVCIFSRRTMPLAAAGIVALWCLALGDYQLFHLLDYLPLGLGVAGYLWLESSSRPAWRARRFDVLRWAVAIALMWSCLEKFAYPQWFYPIIQEKPFITFGIARDAFIPMAGVAEFTMGFGLLWTALIRRLSAVALFVIFTAAVLPFGRIDLLGHTLILAVLVSVFVNPTPPAERRVRRLLPAVPAALVVAFAGFAGSYWGLHVAVYGPGGAAAPKGAVMLAADDKPGHAHAPGHAAEPQFHVHPDGQVHDQWHRPVSTAAAPATAATAASAPPHAAAAAHSTSAAVALAQDAPRGAPALPGTK